MERAVAEIWIQQKQRLGKTKSNGGNKMNETKLKEVHKAIDDIFKKETDTKKIKSAIKRKLTKLLA